MFWEALTPNHKPQTLNSKPTLGGPLRLCVQVATKRLKDARCEVAEVAEDLARRLGLGFRVYIGFRVLGFIGFRVYIGFRVLGFIGFRVYIGFRV